MSDWYVLDDNNNAVKAPDMLTGARFMENTERRRVGATEKNGVRVSTVFLGLDHSWVPGQPLLFETMIFGGDHDGHQTRCTTWAEAEQMHAEACELAFGAAKPEGDL